jgi:excisionase family DNA binding protein
MTSPQEPAAPAVPAARSLLNLPEAADYLRVSVRTVHRLLSARRIRAARIGRRLIFKRAELDRLADLQTALS